MQPQLIRTFIAIHLPAEITAVLTQIISTLKAQTPTRAVRWVKPENIHLTLSFLGDTAVSKLPNIATTLDQIAGKISPFRLHLDQLGCFPNRRVPRIIWVGLEGAMAQLKSLKRQIDEHLIPLGWQPEKRPYNPHLTLGRAKESRHLKNMHWNMEIEKVAFNVTAVHHIQSQLLPQGVVYTTIHTSTME